MTSGPFAFEDFPITGNLDALGGLSPGIADRWRPVFMLKYEPETLSESDRLHLIWMMEQAIEKLKAIPFKDKNNDASDGTASATQAQEPMDTGAPGEADRNDQGPPAGEGFGS